ncbi:helix-turn-helix transcriptional regulator [Marinomonas sp. PE14-40]|uniref:helix-turn-helix transcriptional regulator n=1 Tax=Marinomonas sp. PE14-40 TaxID=3060621 RepID=UPI003F67FA7B
MKTRIYDTLPAVIMHIGQVDFYAHVVKALRSIQPLTGVNVIRYSEKEHPSFIHSEKSNHIQQLDKIYSNSAYLEDPVYNAIQGHVETGIYSLDRLAPENFKNTSYYTDFYKKTGWKNETSLIVNHDSGNVISISFTPCNDKEILEQEMKQSFFKSLNAAIYQHLNSQQLTLEPSSHNFEAVIPVCNPLYEEHALTKREAEIVTLILDGNPSPTIAEKCFVSEGTVKNHRKSIYRKLGVKSQCELFHLFLNNSH